jgi:cytochrome c-type biogenesis protein
VIDAPIAYAFTAGLVATVNPCGFPMLPAYLSYFVGADDEVVAGPGTRVLRAVAAAAAVSVGFFIVFVGLGIPVNAGGTWLYRVMPWLTIVIGVALVGLGVAMLLGHRMKVALPRLDKGGGSRQVGSMVLFGVSYAIASLSCTLPIFLTVVAGTTTRSNFASGIVAFVAYTLGMSVVLMVLSVAIALAHGSLVRHIRRVLPYVDRIAGTLLVLVGAYLVYYWVANLSSDPSDPIGSSPIRAVDDLSADATRWLADGGVRLGLTMAAVVAGAVAWAVVRRRRRAGFETAPADEPATTQPV